MKSATLLILASSVFMVVAMLDKSSSAPKASSNTGNSSAPSPKASAAAAPQRITSTLLKSAAVSPNPFPKSSSSADYASSALSSLTRRITSVALPSAPSPLPQKTYSRSELRIARGLVKEELPDGLVLDCGGWVVKSATNPGVYAGDGRGMNAIYANLVVTQERYQFGRLMTVDHGALRESVYPPEMWVPASYVYGMAFLEGYPAASPGFGKGLKVVAAPKGTMKLWQDRDIPVYTVTFTLSD